MEHIQRRKVHISGVLLATRNRTDVIGSCRPRWFESRPDASRGGRDGLEHLLPSSYTLRSCEAGDRCAGAYRSAQWSRPPGTGRTASQRVGSRITDEVNRRS